MNDHLVDFTTAAVAAVMDNESALSDLMSMVSDGTYIEMPRADMHSLATRATQSSLVVANAFGQDLLPGETPDVLRNRMMSMYDTGRLYRAYSISSMNEDIGTAVAKDRTRSSIAGTLGLSPEELSRLDAASDAGDPSAWQLERERFYYK